MASTGNDLVQSCIPADVASSVLHFSWPRIPGPHLDVRPMKFKPRPPAGWDRELKRYRAQRVAIQAVLGHSSLFALVMQLVGPREGLYVPAVSRTWRAVYENMSTTHSSLTSWRAAFTSISRLQQALPLPLMNKTCQIAAGYSGRVHVLRTAFRSGVFTTGALNHFAGHICSSV